MKDHTHFTFIESQEELKEAYEEWSNQKELAIDLEGENNLHYYGVFISLIQISTRDKNWIVDVLTLQNVDPVLDIFRSEEVMKVFHDVGFDLRILNHQFSCRPKNVFDTLLACNLLGRKEIGLDKLLAEMFNITDKSNFQMADWTVRPIPKDMLEYAARDTAYLLGVKDILHNELKEKNRWEWATEEFKHLESLDFILEEKDHSSFSGYSLLTDKERSILKELYALRRTMAEKANKPPYFVISTRKMHELLKAPPKRVEEWRAMRGVHPIVRNHAHEFYEAVKKGKEGSIPKPHHRKVHYTAKQSADLQKISEMRDKLALQHEVPKHMLMNKDQMQEAAITGKLDCLRNWQRELFKGVI